MSALLMYFKVHPSIAIPVGFTLDLVVAYGIAQLIKASA